MWHIAFHIILSQKSKSNRQFDTQKVSNSLTNIPAFWNAAQAAVMFLRSSAVLGPMSLLSTFKTSSRFACSSTTPPSATPTFLWNKFTSWFHHLFPCSPLVCRSTYTTSTPAIRTMLHVKSLKIVTDKARRYPEEYSKSINKNTKFKKPLFLHPQWGFCSVLSLRSKHYSCTLSCNRNVGTKKAAVRMCL